ncbi:disease resistance protein RPM1-like [Macadamia integrifolia]|uniref:disease resistance protein RPM1-like n=1 Tax=Macadamia integrifolia TaxID=60698 RepID=UPI001C52EAD1|nr:disease resistance protein RPM1-like [Macadamia integrifolia]
MHIQQLKGIQFFVGKSFKLSDWICPSVDFDEAEEGGAKDAYLNLGPLLKPSEVSPKEFDKAKDEYLSTGVGLGQDMKSLKGWLFNNSNKTWVCASALDIDLEDIWENIYKQINEFHWNKKYLIVIDDVRDPQVLSKAESWELFMKKLFITPWRLGNIASDSKNTSDDQYSSPPIPLPLPPELEAPGKKMVAKCGGIPYLIIELANLLSTMNANIVEWSCVLHGTDTHLSQEQHPWFNLSSSVDDILPFHVKQFLYLFPTATTIPKRRLTLSWVVEGGLLHQRGDSGISAEEEESTVALPWLQDLQDLNLIQAMKVSSIGIVKSYPIPRDLPLLQILKAGDALRSSDGDDGEVWIHSIADHCGKEDIHSLRIHSSINSPDELEYFITLGSFWVLDLEGVYKPSLPKATGYLINLQYLGLRWTYFDTLPSSVEKLQNLQTLDTKHTDIGDYSTIQKMEKLQHLYLNERHRSEFIT